MQDTIGEDGMLIAADGAPVGIRSCGYFHGPDGECTYEGLTPEAYQIRECGECGARWNYGTPADRCPHEDEHEEPEDFSAYPAGVDPRSQRCDDCGAEPGEECRYPCLGEAIEEDRAVGLIALAALIRKAVSFPAHASRTEPHTDGMAELISHATGRSYREVRAAIVGQADADERSGLEASEALIRNLTR